MFGKHRVAGSTRCLGLPVENKPATSIRPDDLETLVEERKVCEGAGFDPPPSFKRQRLRRISRQAEQGVGETHIRPSNEISKRLILCERAPG